MRMPPGWDGMETIEQLWRVDPRLQVVICTAHSDHPWEELLERLDGQDRLVILKKPFDMIEVSQLARALTAKWSLAREAEAHAYEQQLTNERLSRSERDLRHTGEELQAFAHAVSHDLRSPLAIIESFSRLLSEEVQGGDERVRHFAQRIAANARTGQDLVTGLLGLTEIARTHMELQRVDIHGLACEVVAHLRETAPAREASVHVQPGLCAWGDARLVRIVLRNLLENAWKFTSTRDHTRVDIGVLQQDADEVVFYVRDNGCGFDMEYAGQLFQTFRRLHARDEYPGTGVGLVTVRRVLLRLGGRIWAESIPDQGSTFCFSLPARARRPACAASDFLN
jgi:two-component system NtrC family sensor kinase